jgi:peptidoglycan hydrolase-like protein with peptidoglycan-binding domain
MRTIWKTFGVTTAMVLITGTALAQTSSTQGASGVGSSGTDQQPKESTQPDSASKSERTKEQMGAYDRMKRDGEMRSHNGRHARIGQTMSMEEARAAQEALRTKGFDPGPVDGKFGPRTTQALRDFQKQEGLRVTGRLDGETRAKLGV